MKKILRGTICGAGLLGVVAGCNSFLKGGDLTKDPNNPLTATPAQFFGATQSDLWHLLTSDLARLTSQWMQQMVGVQRQQFGIYEHYVVEQGDYDGVFARAYQGGGALDFPPRYRLSDNGELATNYELIPLPRTGTVYTETTVHMPVPGLRTPYSLVIVELDGVGVRALVKVTGAEPGTVDIGDRGRLTLRRVAVRSGVPDYGYMFEPERAAA